MGHHGTGSAHYQRRVRVAALPVPLQLDPLQASRDLSSAPSGLLSHTGLQQPAGPTKIL